jgi:hypothetical protein
MPITNRFRRQEAPGAWITKHRKQIRPVVEDCAVVMDRIFKGGAA